MSQLTNIFFIISTALLIPVMLVQLYQLLQVLLTTGAVLQELIGRSTEKQEQKQLLEALEQKRSKLPVPQSSSLIGHTVRKLIEAQSDTACRDYYLREAEMEWHRRIEPLRNLTKLGPAMGLMGTLIPLGPALVGLASGDIATMSQNLVIAFATTVVGLLVGMIATTLSSVRRTWYQKDAALLAFAAERIQASANISSRLTEDSTTITNQRKEELAVCK